MRVPFAGTAVLFASLALYAQTPDPLPSFEAATVKLNTTGSHSSSSNGTKSQVLMTNLTLKRLVERAYNVKPFQVTGPGWMEDVHFDIAAKFPLDTRNEDRLLMLRGLLEERFKLSVHRETHDMPGYALVVAKGGFKLKPVTSDGSSTNTNGGRVVTMTAKGVSMAQLADQVARELGQIVVDKTGIDGVYDFVMSWLHEDSSPSGAANASTEAPTADPTPSLPDALPETIGVRLQSQKVPVEVIVVDHIERIPIEN